MICIQRVRVLQHLSDAWIEPSSSEKSHRTKVASLFLSGCGGGFEPATFGLLAQQTREKPTLAVALTVVKLGF
jgi:hypothetical protein